MNPDIIWQVPVIGVCYLILTLIMPAVFFYRYIKEKPFVVRVAFYQVAGNGYILFWGFVLAYLNFFKPVLVFLLMTVIPLLAKLLIFRRDLIRLVIDYIIDKKEKVVTSRGALRSLRLWLGGKLKDAYYRYLRYHYLEILILIALSIFAVWYYGYFKFHYFTYANSDEATHLFWLNGLLGGDPFPVGLYPHAMHFILGSIHSLCGLQTIIINHYFSIVIMLMIHFMIFASVKTIYRSTPAAIFSTGFFLLADMFTAQRYHSTLPMELGMISMLIFLILMREFVKTRDMLTMWFAAIAFGWSFHCHGYVVIVCVLVYLAFMIVYAKGLIILKRFLRSILIVLIAAAVALVPFGAGMALGHPLEQSIDWAMDVVGIDRNKEELKPIPTIDHSVKEDEEAVEGETVEGEVPGQETEIITKTETETAQVKAPEPVVEVKPLTANQIQFRDAKNFSDYLYATEHLLTDMSVQLVNNEKAALAIYLLLIFAFLYGIGKLVQSQLLFRKQKKKLMEEEMEKKDIRRKKQEFLLQRGHVIVAPLLVLFGLGVTVMSLLGLPAVIHPYRAAMILAPLLPLILAPPIALIEEVLCLIPLKQKRAISFALVVLAGAGLGYYYAEGPVKKLYEIECYAVTNELSNKLSYDLIAEHPRNSWTVISPVNDLLSIRYYGYHYEVIDLLMGIETGKKSITMPTDELYVVLEKEALPNAASCYMPDYYDQFDAVAGKLDVSLVDLNYYDLGLPWMSADSAYATFRRITMSKLFCWMEEMKKAYPNEIEVYSEDKRCIVYRIRQSADFPINLARDYRIENYGVNAQVDFDQRYLEEHGESYEK